MKYIQHQIVILLILGLILPACSSLVEKEPKTFKEAFEGKFLVGNALNVEQITGQEPEAIELTKKHFNSIVAENCMKMEEIHPSKDVYFWDEADAFVAFGEANDMHIVGHTLVWHSQAGDWIFLDEKGEDVSRDELIERMKNHIHTIVTRYKGRVHGWDVVNEAILGDGTWRESKWFKIIGPEFVQLAFEFAREADPEAELYYNDYGVSGRAKCDGIYDMVKDLIEKGVKVDGVGLQGHVNIDSPEVAEMEKSIEKLATLDVNLMITELDMTILPWPSDEVTAEISLNYELSQEYNPYAEKLPDLIYQEMIGRYTDYFEMFLKHQKKISRVTFWGVHDGQSWRNYWPIKGRTDYPLLFDRKYQMKSGVEEILKMAAEKN